MPDRTATAPIVPAWWPKSVASFQTYSWTTFRHDALAGLTVGLVALPLAMAFAIASGMTPQAGIYCAIVTGFVISALGGSRVQIGGPTGAFVIVVAGIISTHGVAGLYICTMMAGVLLIVLGLTGMGRAVEYIPRPVVMGFTSGIAVLIASTQVNDFLGLGLTGVPADFAGRVRTLLANVGATHAASLGLGLAAIGIIAACNKWAQAVPGTVVALIGGTIAVAVFQLPIETVGSRFGALPSGLPTIVVPHFEVGTALTLLSPAITVAMLGAIESLMSAVVADRLSGDRHNPNVELVGQGVANVLSPLVGGLPATGAIARTATNIRSGARTPVAGMIHAAVLLLIVLVGSTWAARIPMPVLAAILLVVSARMGEWHEVPRFMRHTWTDRSVWLAAFGLTVFADLTVAVQVGMTLAALLYVRRVSSTTTVSRVTPQSVEQDRAHVLQDKHIPADVAMFRVHGPFLFGATAKLRVIADQLPQLPPTVIIRLRNMTAIDATGLHAFEDLAAQVRASGRSLIFCGARQQPRAVMNQTGFVEAVGAANVCPNVERALARAAEIRVQPPHDAATILADFTSSLRTT